MNQVGAEAEAAVIGAEAEFRTAFDSADATLNAVKATRPNLPQLKAVNLAGARLVTRVSALRTAMQPLLATAFGESLVATYSSVIESLNQTSQSVALAVVSRQPSHLAVAEVRFTRLASLLHTLRTKLLALPVDVDDARYAAMVDDLVDGQLSDALLNLVAVTERSGERAVFPLELFDISTWRLQPLAAALNLRPRPDPILFQFTARLAVLLMLGVLVAKLCPIPHAYWLPFTILVVSQTDYGATRKRAVERLVGTLAGCALASGLLFLHLPRGAALAGVAIAGFIFSFLLKRNYRVAVALVTIMVVLLIDLSGPANATFAVALERIAFTAAGGAVALAAALAFWPSWERTRFPPVLAEALRANQHYLSQVVSRLQAGGQYEANDIAAKRTAEQANAAAFGSLARLYADPASQRGGVELAAVIANGSQRLTRFLNLLLLSATPSAPPRNEAALQSFRVDADSGLRDLIDAVLGAADATPAVARNENLLATSSGGAIDRSELDLLERARTEIQAMQQAICPGIGSSGDFERAQSARSPLMAGE